MHVAFFHERFLFRFGHDRTMLLHGRELVRRGHRVSFVALRGEAEVVARLGGRLILLPEARVPYAELDRYAVDHLRDHWDTLFAEGAPDRAVNGGWPFYAAGSLFAERGVPSVYFDAGVTPLEGLSPEERPVHERLRRLRRAHMGRHDRTVSVSRFIALTQTLPDAPRTPNAVVLNGVDHILDPPETALWSAAAPAPTPPLPLGRARLLHLGRWEGGYKNKAGALEVLRGVLAEGLDVELAVLAEGDADLPADLRHRVTFLGHPDDAGLRALMTAADAGVSTSLWEGFNLPLGEMQALGRPAFALDVGAHREVAFDPALLCASPAGMVGKIAAVLGHGSPALPAARVEAYRRRFAWARAGAELEAQLVAAGETDRRRLVLIDLTNAARDPANSGVIRVARRLSRALVEVREALPVVFDEGLGDYRLPDADEAKSIASYGGPAGTPASAGARRTLARDWLAARGRSLADVRLFCPETILGARVEGVGRWVASHGVPVSAVLHDLIPLTHPQFCDPGIVAAFPAYVAFLRRARVLIANSAATAAEWTRLEGEGGPALVVEPLAADLGPRPPSAPLEAHSGRARILTVSTLEPRKNHGRLLDAYARARAAAPEIAFELHLVGNGYEGEGSVAALVAARAAVDPSIMLHGVVEDARLMELYEACDFTVYPSLVEGFGLPVVESLWRRRPVICGSEGATGELGAPGGAQLCDVSDVGALADAILRLARDVELRRTLSLAASLRGGRGWRDYGAACLRHIGGEAPATAPSAQARVAA